MSHMHTFHTWWVILGIQHNICAPCGSCLLQNPSIDDPPNAGLSNKADYKGGQKKQFGNYRWISCQDASLLDAERCEFILIGATEDLQGNSSSFLFYHCMPCNAMFSWHLTYYLLHSCKAHCRRSVTA